MPPRSSSRLGPCSRLASFLEPATISSEMGVAHNTTGRALPGGSYQEVRVGGVRMSSMVALGP